MKEELAKYGQEHLLQHYDTLTPDQQQELIKELE